MGLFDRFKKKPSQEQIQVEIHQRRVQKQQDAVLHKLRQQVPKPQATPTNPRAPISVPTHMQPLKDHAQRLGMSPGRVAAINRHTSGMEPEHPEDEVMREPLMPPEEIVGDLVHLLDELDDEET